MVSYSRTHHSRLQNVGMICAGFPSFFSLGLKESSVSSLAASVCFFVHSDVVDLLGGPGYL